MWKLLKYCSRKTLSSWVGTVMHFPLPPPLSWASIFIFAVFYGIKLSEAEKSIFSYRSIGDFFVRRLRLGVRPLARSAVVHPADSRILQSGVIQNGKCIQAKGLLYSVKDLTVDPDWIEKFENGYFITYYLCPTDYHRVHSPVDGFLRRAVLVPGDLWPVHDAAVSSIDNLYGVNERIVLELATDFGAVTVVLVGATNVGAIETAFDPSLKGNKNIPFTDKRYEIPIEVKKGQELGLFRMGSTVVVLYSEEFRHLFGGTLLLGPQVKVLSALTSK